MCMQHAYAGTERAPTYTVGVYKNRLIKLLTSFSCFSSTTLNPAAHPRVVVRINGLSGGKKKKEKKANKLHITGSKPQLPKSAADNFSDQLIWQD